MGVMLRVSCHLVGRFPKGMEEGCRGERGWFLLVQLRDIKFINEREGGK